MVWCDTEIALIYSNKRENVGGDPIVHFIYDRLIKKHSRLEE